MKKLIILGVIGLTFLSCKKESKYFSLTENQLDFVSYAEGQALQFIDTSMARQVLKQSKIRREFREAIGLYGKSGNFYEEYETAYYSENNSSSNLYIQLNALNPNINISFFSYQATVRTDLLEATIPSLKINGKEYVDVYRLTLYKNGLYIYNYDTATLYHNKQYGIIQLAFPDGKNIVRSN